MDEPRIVGLKDSSGDMGYFHGAADLLAHRPDWSLLIGPEERLLDAVLAGGHGGVSGGANLFPALYVSLFNACRAGDAARAFQLHAQVLRVGTALYRIGRHPSAVIKGIKCALACLGICDDFMAEPFHRFRASERALVEQRLASLQAEIAGLRLEPGREEGDGPAAE
jgi:4-hydroxy-tetrahydrodipicolinate synthase